MKKKANTENTINIISEFPSRGTLSRDFVKSYKFLIPTISLTLFFLTLLFWNLNSYLKKYKIEKNL